jgi:hypothetical protein
MAIVIQLIYNQQHDWKNAYNLPFQYGYVYTYLRSPSPARHVTVGYVRRDLQEEAGNEVHR